MQANGPQIRHSTHLPVTKRLSTTVWSVRVPECQKLQMKA